MNDHNEHAYIALVMALFYFGLPALIVFLSFIGLVAVLRFVISVVDRILS